MPSYFPEGDVAQPGDSEWRSLQKWCSLLYATGPKALPMYPEGTQPLPGDDEQRLLVKIDALRA